MKDSSGRSSPDAVSGQQKVAVIIGGGPAGLTAALEFLRRTDVHPIVLEAGKQVGGIARTEVYKGNRIDIGGHRFFSKSDRVMDWWLEIMPLEETTEDEVTIRYHNQERRLSPAASGALPTEEDLVMLLRRRKSRIYYLRKLFDYPISLSIATVRNLGLMRTALAGLSYLKAVMFPLRQEVTLEDFLINRFGRQLYLTFFRDYTEKVWGVPCEQITAEWGAQRIKGLSIAKVIAHYLRQASPNKDIRQKATETSLIERFLYPKLGPGQMWEEVARRVVEGGGQLFLRTSVVGVVLDGQRVVAVEVRDADGVTRRLSADYVISTMPIKDLVAGLEPAPPESIQELARGLVYRDFITVGLLVERLKIGERDGSPVQDNWIYIQEPEVKVGRLQIFNNWSPYLVADDATTWLGLEYFCNEGDDLWSMHDDELKRLAARELVKIDLLRDDGVKDAVVIRVPKTYPAYFGTYDQFGTLRAHLDAIENLFLIGRNGMHRYNNQDHSMLTAMAAVDNIAAGRKDKANIWAVNVEAEYHEEK